MTKLATFLISVLVLGACKPVEPPPGIWREIDLSPAAMQEFCETSCDAADDADACGDEIQRQAITTQHWTGDLRRVPSRGDAGPTA